MYVSGSSDSHDLRDVRPSLLLAIAGKRAAPGHERQLIQALREGRLPYDEVAAEVQRILQERGVLDKTHELLNAYQEQAVR